MSSAKAASLKSIRTLFLLAMAALVLVLSLPLLYSGSKLLDALALRLGSEIMAVKLQALVAPLDRRYETLKRVGLEDSGYHLAEIKTSALAEFKEFRYMESGAVLVVSAEGELVLGSEFAGPEDPNFIDFFHRLPGALSPEIIRCTAGGEKKLAAVLFYPPWQSHIGITVDAAELFASRNAFLRINLLVLAAVLAGGILFTWAVRRYLVLPLVWLADYANRVSHGDLIAHPQGTFILELGRLREDIATMVASLCRRMEESENQLATIREREGELRESEERYRNIFNAPSDAILIHDAASGEILDVNRGMLEMYGYRYDEVLRAEMADISLNQPPYSAKEALAKIAATAEGEQRFEWRSRRKNGELFWSEVVLRRISFAGRLCVIAVVRDIDQRKKAAEALANEKEQLAITLQSIGDGVITADTSGRVVLLNGVAAQLTGWSQAEAAGCLLPEVFNIVNELSGERSPNPVEKVLASGLVVALENHTVLIAKDGRRRAIADSGAPIRGRDGKIIGVVLVFRDVTEKQRTAEELLKVKKLESVGVLAAGIAHDFNNLLTSLLGNVDLAGLLLKRLGEGSELAEVSELLTEAKKAGQRARGLTQQLLTFARGGAPIRKVASLDELIRDSAAFVLRGSGVICRYEIPPDLWLVEIDRDQISQVIQNIVLNARQAMGDKGKITISCRNLRDRDDALKRWQSSYVAIAIADGGPGVAAADLERIFDPYYTTKSDGCGLGLAICHSIVSKHGGHIEVVSRPGVGTTFTIMLPANRGSARPAELELPPQAPRRPAKILVVDDEEMIVEVAKRALSYLGHQVEAVAEGGLAVEQYRAAKERGEPFDLVIMDLTIPGGMGGLEATGKLLEFDPSAQIVVASGYADDPVLAEYRSHGFVARLHKPFLLEDLSAVISRILDA